MCVNSVTVSRGSALLSSYLVAKSQKFLLAYQDSSHAEW